MPQTRRSDLAGMGRSGIWVRIQYQAEGWSGRLIPGRPDRIHVHFPPERGPDHLPLTTVVEVGIAQRGMANALRDRGRLIKVDRRREDALECVFELDHPDRLLEEVRDAVIDQRMDRRRRMRAAAETQDVMVPVTLQSTPAHTQRVVGRLLDGGAGGIGLSFPVAAEPLLCRSRTLRAKVPLPGLKGVGEWVCDVRYRTLLDDNKVRYGLQFVSDGVAVDPPGPELQALWDCACGTGGLLAETHAFCPACGAEAAGPTRHPTWRELATVDVHPLCGTDVSCEHCGVAYGYLAMFCGHCGEALPGDTFEELPTQMATKPGK